MHMSAEVNKLKITSFFWLKGRGKWKKGSLKMEKEEVEKNWRTFLRKYKRHNKNYSAHKLH